MKQNQQTFTGAIAFLIAVTVLSSSQAFSAGFEKSVFWSGHYAGMAGASTSTVTGAESLAFNPAGLAGSKSEVSLNFSPTTSKFSGPITTAGTSVDSKSSFSPVFGALANYRISDKLSAGIGAFVTGGTKAVYEGVALGAAVPSATIQADLGITELAAGAGYELIDGLKVGAAYRLVMVKANLGTVLGTTPIPNYAAFDSLSSSKSGFSAGLMYSPAASKWGVGLDYRSEVSFSADGNVSLTPLAGPGAGTAGAAQAASMAGVFPQEVSVGGHYDVADSIRVAATYSWAEYIKNSSLGISGITAPPIALNWGNLNNLRLGVECSAVRDWAFRAGYAYASQVTPSNSARATFAAPGAGNTFTLGAGHSFGVLMANAALEYSKDSGTTTVADQPIFGDYSASAMAAHLGVTYAF